MEVDEGLVSSSGCCERVSVIASLTACEVAELRGEPLYKSFITSFLTVARTSGSSPV